MTVGDLMDMFEEKIATGEISRDDALMVEGECDADGEESDWVQILDVRKADSSISVLEINATFGRQP